MSTSKRWLPATILLLAAARYGTAGTITTYSDRPTFTADMGVPLTVEDFTGDAHFPISTGVLNSATDLVVGSGAPIKPGDIKPGVTYSTAIGDSFFFNIDAGGGYEGGFLDGFAQATYENKLTITFDGPVSGFGFDTNSLMGSRFLVRIIFGSGPDYSDGFAAPPTTDLEFFGFKSDASDIVGAEILGVGGFFSFSLDNFTFPQPGAAVPEPSTVALGIAALALSIPALRRRRKFKD